MQTQVWGEIFATTLAENHAAIVFEETIDHHTIEAGHATHMLSGALAQIRQGWGPAEVGKSVRQNLIQNTVGRAIRPEAWVRIPLSADLATDVLSDRMHGPALSSERQETVRVRLEYTLKNFGLKAMKG